ncbi:type II secretion system F family protein [Actinomycetaceae bacterium TAE3-ERU4]|nr:type II secretion system F family protein [Actinomycetaceae bacterium TAE3-ERU4]
MKRRERHQNSPEEIEKIAQKLRKYAAQLRAGSPLTRIKQELFISTTREPQKLRGAKKSPKEEKWQNCALKIIDFSEETGTNLSQTLDSLAQIYESKADAWAEQKAILAGPQASAKLLAVLPAIAGFAGEISGLKTIQILLGENIGWVLLAVGIAFNLIGWLMSRYLCQKCAAESSSEYLEKLSTVCELTKISMSAGIGLAQTLQSVGKNQKMPGLVHLAEEIENGQTPQTPSSNLDAQLWKVLKNNWEEGIDPSAQLEQLIVTAQRNQRLKIRTNAARLGVKLTLPLALCYLPAFVFLGIAPTVIGLFLVP